MVGDDSAPDVFALIDAAAALTAMFAAPLCGLLADRTMSRLGRRRPWLLGGSAVGLLGSADVPVGPTAIGRTRAQVPTTQ